MLRLLRAALVVALLLPIAILDFTTARGSYGQTFVRPWAASAADSRAGAGLTASARRYLEVKPIASRGFLALAVAEDECGDTNRGLRLVRRASNLDPRLGAARFRLANHHLRTGQVAAAIDQYRVLQRLDARLAGVMTPLLVELARSRPARLLMAQRFANDPNLLRLLEDGGRVGLEPEALLDLVSKSDLSRIPRGVATAQRLIPQSLVRRGQYRQAWMVWHALAGRRPSASIFDGTFQGQEGTAPFGWSLTNNQYVQTRMRPGDGPDGSGALSVDAYGSLPLVAAQQSLVLAEGRHRLQFASLVSAEADSPFAWTVKCASGNQLAEIVMPASPQWRRHISELIVPANCPMQLLVLQKGPTPTEGPYRLLVSHVRIVPGGAGPPLVAEPREP